MGNDFLLPEDIGAHTDKYFSRTRAVLLGEGMNPRVAMQVFIRQGPGRVYGIDEAVAMLGGLAQDDGLVVHALAEGSGYEPCEPVMRIEGRLADFVELETLYLGAITAATSRAAGIEDPNPQTVRGLAGRIRELLPDKQLMYFGARHWHWSQDAAIGAAAIEGGFNACATDVSAREAGLAGGVGTIPHALVLAMAHKHGAEHATREAALAFDRHIAPAVPRIALVDTFNREIDDSLDTAAALGDALWGVRLDTAGENLAQGAPAEGPRFWAGPGVTVESARTVRKALDDAGHENVNIVLSSGFGNLDKVRAFVEGERRHGRLFEAVGVGGMFPARFATADIVTIEGQTLAKTGRGFMNNPRLTRVL